MKSGCWTNCRSNAEPSTSWTRHTSISRVFIAYIVRPRSSDVFLGPTNPPVADRCPASTLCTSAALRLALFAPSLPSRRRLRLMGVLRSTTPRRSCTSWSRISRFVRPAIAGTMSPHPSARNALWNAQTAESPGHKSRPNRIARKPRARARGWGLVSGAGMVFCCAETRLSRLGSSDGVGEACETVPVSWSLHPESRVQVFHLRGDGTG